MVRVLDRNRNQNPVLFVLGLRGKKTMDGDRRRRESERERENGLKKKSADSSTQAWMALLTQIKSKHYSTGRHFLIEY